MMVYRAERSHRSLPLAQSRTPASSKGVQLQLKKPGLHLKGIIRTDGSCGGRNLPSLVSNKTKEVKVGLNQAVINTASVDLMYLEETILISI